jgi:hypothetical protein
LLLFLSACQSCFPFLDLSRSLASFCIRSNASAYAFGFGPDKFHRFVVVEFDTYQSPEYEEAAAFRRNGAGEVGTVMVEGGDATKL